MRDPSASIFGECKLAGPCPQDAAADCRAVVGAAKGACAERLAVLRIEVARYLDKPGCNERTKATAMARLRHAWEMAGRQ